MVAEAAAAIDQSVRDALPFQAIVTDLQLPDGDGRAIVRLARERLPSCPVLMMTGSGSVSGSVEAIRLGAVTVLEKPVSLETLENELFALYLPMRADVTPAARVPQHHSHLFVA